MASPAFDAEYYRENYRDYRRQTPARKLRVYARLVERHCSAAVPSRIHDIGCGFGHFLGSLEESWEICGSDVSEFAIARAAEEFPRGHFAVAGATARGVFDGRFGVVTAFDVLEHVPDLDAAAAAIAGQLVPGGCFIFAVPVYDGLSGPIIRALDHDETHVHKWPRRRWFEWAEAHFDVLEWIGAVRYLLLSLYYVHLTTRLLRDHTPAIIVACRLAGGEAADGPPDEAEGGGQ